MNGRRRLFLQALAGAPLAAGPLAGLASAAGRDRRSYARVGEGQPVQFPDDHAAHPAYALEWWYVTGFLRVGRTGAQRTFEVTFFRYRPRPGDWLDNPSAFTPRQVLMAHAALGDPQVEEFRYWRRLARLGLDGGGVSAAELDVRIRDWRLRDTGEGHWHLSLGGEAGPWDLQLIPNGIPVRHGTDGISPKTADGSVASYYYSLPALTVRGRLPVDGHSQPVTGEAWFDHEWTSTLLPETAAGWDWVGLRFEDGSALMAYRFRDAEGATTFASGTWITPERSARHLYPDELAWQPRRYWHSPATGYDYAVAWRLRVGERTFDLEALFDGQEMVGNSALSPTYWEGAVRVTGAGQGRGFLEMTRLEGGLG